MADAVQTTGVRIAMIAMEAGGAAVADARNRLSTIRTNGGWVAKYEELDAERALAVAEQQYERACAVHAAAAETDFRQQCEAYETADAPDVHELAAVLKQAAAIERRRAERSVEFERRTGRQYVGETGLWPEFITPPAGGDDSRLSHWLWWARDRRGLK